MRNGEAEQNSIDLLEKSTVSFVKIMLRVGSLKVFKS